MRRTQDSAIESPVTWIVYGALWPLMNTLATLEPHEREMLSAGMSPIGEQAIVFSELKIVSLEADIDHDEEADLRQNFAVASLTVPFRMHVLPYAALYLDDDDPQFDGVMTEVRRIYHETSTVANPSPGARVPGARLLDVLLTATRHDFETLIQKAEDELTDAFSRSSVTPCSRKGTSDQKRLALAAKATAAQNVLNHLNEQRRLETIAAIRAAWKRQGRADRVV